MAAKAANCALRSLSIFYLLGCFLLLLLLLLPLLLFHLCRSKDQYKIAPFCRWLIELQWHNINNNQCVHLILLQYPSILRSYCNKNHHNNRSDSDGKKEKWKTIWIGYITHAHTWPCRWSSLDDEQTDSYRCNALQFAWTELKANATTEWKNRCTDEWNRAENKILQTTRENGWWLGVWSRGVLRPFTHCFRPSLNDTIVRALLHTLTHSHITVL